MFDKRATTPELKREVVERIYEVWLRADKLRLGQLISLACPGEGDPFNVEDLTLVERLESSHHIPRKRLENVSTPPKS